VFTRRGNDWTKRFKEIADDAWHVSAGSAIIDGEVVAPAADGTIEFSVLQNELKGRSTKIVMVAFDLFYLNGHDLRKLPLIDRKALLKKALADTDIQFSERFEADGGEMFKHACKIGLEGVVSKVRDSKYASGRINDWVKKTCAQRHRQRFTRAPKPLLRNAQSYSKRIAHSGIWVEPTLLAEIEYRAKSAEGREDCDPHNSRTCRYDPDGRTRLTTAVAVAALSSVLRAYQVGSSEPSGFGQRFSAWRHGRGERRDDAREICIPVRASGIVQRLAFKLSHTKKAVGQSSDN
jgi:bifunctional non-homologous end joining protein LigD